MYGKDLAFINEKVRKNCQIEAKKNGGQKNATQLKLNYNEIKTAFKNNDSVKLPSEVFLRTCFIFNRTNKIISIFPYFGHKIFGLKINESYKLLPKKAVMFIGVKEFEWMSNENF